MPRRSGGGGGRSEDLEQPLALEAGVESEGVGEKSSLVGPDALKASREVVDHGLGEQHVADEAVDPRSHAERERIEFRELSPERLLDRLQEMPHAGIGRAPRVDAESGLLVENGLDTP